MDNSKFDREKSFEEESEEIMQNTPSHESMSVDNDSCNEDDSYYDESSDSIHEQQQYNPKKELKTNEEKNKILKILSPQKEIREYIKKQNDRKVDITIKDKDQALSISDFPFNLINKNCIEMNIQLSGFRANQSDFDLFCEKFSNLPYLKSLKFNYYNNNIQYFDSLFQSIANIEEVFISLKDFKKIKFKNDFKEPILGIHKFGINIKDANFKSKQDKINFENYFSCLKNLTDFSIELKNQSYLQLLLKLPKKTNITVILSSFEADLQLCDSLVSLRDEQKLNITKVETPIDMLNLYLIQQGFTIKVNPYFTRKRILYINQLREQDLKFAIRYPKQFKQIVEREYKRITFLYTEKDTRYFRIRRKRLITKNLEIITNKMIIPLIESIERIYLNKNFPRHQTYYKEQGVWRVSIMKMEQTLEVDKVFEILFEHMTWIKVTSIDYYSYNSDSFIQVMKKIEGHNYLIFYEIDFNHIDLQNYNQYFQFMIQTYSDHSQVIQKRCQDNLRFFAFKKLIFNEIPLPKQTFYDLLDD